MGGGCSGFQYKFDLDDKITDEDHIFTLNGAKVVIDELSLENFLTGSELDFIEDLSGSEFLIKNPKKAVLDAELPQELDLMWLVQAQDE